MYWDMAGSDIALPFAQISHRARAEYEADEDDDSESGSNDISDAWSRSPLTGAGEVGEDGTRGEEV